jgi:hypothetical protein
LDKETAFPEKPGIILRKYSQSDQLIPEISKIMYIKPFIT